MRLSRAVPSQLPDSGPVVPDLSEGSTSIVFSLAILLAKPDKTNRNQLMHKPQGRGTNDELRVVRRHMKVPEQIVPFWQAFAQTQPIDPTPRFLEAFYFDDNQPSADELAELVLSGRKRATAGLVWSFESAGALIPQPGSLNVVTTFGGQPVCVIETQRVDIVAFANVSEEFAATEGEGDGSLIYWRRVHEAYFGRECERIGRVPDPQMPVVCERFEVVYPKPRRQ